jgi:hypothetical protein
MDAREVTSFPLERFLTSNIAAGSSDHRVRNVLRTSCCRPGLIRSVCVTRASEAVDADVTEDLCCALYNSVFNQVVVVLSLGSVRVYQAEVSAVLRCRSAR